MKYFIVLILLLFNTYIYAQKPQPYTVYDMDQLVARTSNPDSVFVVNFWATWCAPCVKELPVFDTVRNLYSGKPLKVLLVSMDFADEYQKKLPAFISKKKLKTEVIWLNETDASSFIPKMDERWGGSLPATMVVGNGKKLLYEQPVTVAEVEKMIDAAFIK